jgi:hypothetical protein
MESMNAIKVKNFMKRGSIKSREYENCLIEVISNVENWCKAHFFRPYNLGPRKWTSAKIVPHYVWVSEKHSESTT